MQLDDINYKFGMTGTDKNRVSIIIIDKYSGNRISAGFVFGIGNMGFDRHSGINPGFNFDRDGKDQVKITSIDDLE